MAKKTVPPTRAEARARAAAAAPPSRRNDPTLPPARPAPASRPATNRNGAPTRHDDDDELPIGAGKVIEGTGAPGPKPGRLDPAPKRGAEPEPEPPDDDDEADEADFEEADDDDETGTDAPGGRASSRSEGAAEELPIPAIGADGREQGRALAVAYIAALDLLDQRAADYYNWLAARGIKGARRWHRVPDGDGDLRHYRAGRKGKIIAKGGDPDVEIID